MNMALAAQIMRSVDVTANRARQEWTVQDKIGRVLWALVEPIFRMVPRPLWGVRRLILRLFGAQVGKDVHVYPTASITIPWNVILRDGCAVGDRAILYALGPITVGPRATISQHAHICAGSHNWRDPIMPLIKPPIEIGADAWVCADAYIGPGVTIGDNAIVGARAVVTKNIAPGLIVAGNPARKIGERNR